MLEHNFLWSWTRRSRARVQCAVKWSQAQQYSGMLSLWDMQVSRRWRDNYSKTKIPSKTRIPRKVRHWHQDCSCCRELMMLIRDLYSRWVLSDEREDFWAAYVCVSCVYVQYMYMCMWSRVKYWCHARQNYRGREGKQGWASFECKNDKSLSPTKIMTTENNYH